MVENYQVVQGENEKLDEDIDLTKTKDQPSTKKRWSTKDYRLVIIIC